MRWLLDFGAIGVAGNMGAGGVAGVVGVDVVHATLVLGFGWWLSPGGEAGREVSQEWLC